MRSGLKAKMAEATSEAPAPEAIAALEEQRAALEKERDELLQQVRLAPAAEAVSELKGELKSKEEALSTAVAAQDSLVVELQAAKLALEEQVKSAEDAQSSADLAAAKLQVLSTRPATLSRALRLEPTRSAELATAKLQADLLAASSCMVAPSCADYFITIYHSYYYYYLPFLFLLLLLLLFTINITITISC